MYLTLLLSVVIYFVHRWLVHVVVHWSFTPPERECVWCLAGSFLSPSPLQSFLWSIHNLSLLLPYVSLFFFSDPYFFPSIQLFFVVPFLMAPVDTSELFLCYSVQYCSECDLCFSPGSLVSICPLFQLFHYTECSCNPIPLQKHSVAMQYYNGNIAAFKTVSRSRSKIFLHLWGTLPPLIAQAKNWVLIDWAHWNWAIVCMCYTRTSHSFVYMPSL